MGQPWNKGTHKDECKYGHTLSGHNLIVREKGHYRCRMCLYAQQKQYIKLHPEKVAERNAKGRIARARSEYGEFAQAFLILIDIHRSITIKGVTINESKRQNETFSKAQARGGKEKRSRGRERERRRKRRDDH